MQTNVKTTTRRLTIAAVFMAMNIALSSFGISVPGGHLYLNDIVICLAALLLGPFEAFAVGGIGAFLGDLFFYPTPMFVSLVTHGLQAVVISLIAHKAFKQKPVAASILAVTVGAVIMIVGYTLGRAYIYATPETAVLKLPYQIAQATLGAVLGTVLYWLGGIKKLFDRYIAGESI
ncbi:MAG: ECF transporter S component [Oscillospiraceae bacterium]|nr:ECF transporter S component [Oscillospiraceae bacterium]